ncbi:GTP 3',8-cyclase MoaA [uncultured Flavobacterium sp.]|uniref:GTP 3',8-cyclase MoaA n=1 Tax=uncultured Flavobacterium sp. TaxID=165435 RepID=UPI0025D513F2|nr:GTP 3',8-cyclase MoaA [uncultured Flavobacterium sp.]
MILDKFNRAHEYLRISLTDNCNLRCFYCMPEESYDFAPASRLMQTDEILKLSEIFVAEGVKKIRLTGGEPLVRKDAGKIISLLSNLPVELTLTTNGTRIHDYIHVLKDANIKSLNISLDTLKADQFEKITRRNQFQLVMDNINLLLSEGFIVKINIVVMNGLNDQEINDFIAWTKYVPVQIRFIEFMPFTGNKWSSNQVFSRDQILDRISQKYAFSPILGTIHDTAKGFSIAGHAGNFAIISTMTNPFCEGCNRMRLTADGKLKNCLFSKGETDLLTPLRNGEPILPLIHSNIQSKAKELGGQFSNAIEKIEAITIENRSMITIGG